LDGQADRRSEVTRSVSGGIRRRVWASAWVALLLAILGFLVIYPILTLLVGADGPQPTALVGELETANPDLEVEVYEGGQPHYPLLIDPGWRAFYEERGWPLQRWLGYGIELDNAVIDAGRPATFGFHLCRGNQLSRWLVAGSYDPIAGPVFGTVHADRLLLEYDDERSGTFDALGLVPDDKVVVLGLVTTKTSRVETAQDLAARLKQAGARIGSDRLAISPQCGFATSSAGNAITPEAQRAKLALLVRVAQDVLGP